MHANSLKLMGAFVNEYDVADKTVVDIGSLDVNGTYRPLFTGTYIGADITPGPNVDVVIGTRKWKRLSGVDAVICGQTLEHVKYRTKLLDEMHRILKDDGLACVIAPGRGGYHGFPHFYGNLTVEELTDLMWHSGFEVISCTQSRNAWKDVCCIARKGTA